MLLFCILYGNQEVAIEVASSRPLWQGRILHPTGGDFWVVAPSLRRCVGPVSLFDFVLAMNGRNSDSPLALMMRDAAAQPELPPHHLTPAGELPPA